MTIERQKIFMGIPVPRTAKECEVGKDYVLRSMHFFERVPVDSIHVISPNEVTVFTSTITFDGVVMLGSSQASYVRERINTAKIRSSGKVMGTIYRYQPDK